MENSKQGSTHS